MLSVLTLEGNFGAPFARYYGAAATPKTPVDFPHFQGVGTVNDPYIVDFQTQEPCNPLIWAKKYRWAITVTAGVSSFCSAFCSSAYSAGVEQISDEFDVSRDVALLGLSLYVLGFAIGPMIWAPLSEGVGRRAAFWASFPIFVAFNLAGAVAPNIITIIVVRFLAGAFGSAPLTNAAAVVGDIWAPADRAAAIAVFSLSPVLGPVMGPLVSGFVVESMGWRWIFWIQTIFSGLVLLVHQLLVPETYRPVLLARRAVLYQIDSNREGREACFATPYEGQHGGTTAKIARGMTRPFQFMRTEIIVVCLGLYMSIVYATMYLFFAAYPLVFQFGRGWTASMGGLAFVGIGTGFIIGHAINQLGRRHYAKCQAALPPGSPVPPEERLPLCCAGSVLIPIGLLWFAWTSTPEHHWMLPIAASVPFGCGFFFNMNTIQAYLLDAYELYASSAIAATAIMRAMLATAFPMVATRMYRSLGLNWAGTLVACLSLVCSPMPWLFYRYGAALRKRSLYASEGCAETHREDEAPSIHGLCLSDKA